MVEVVGNEGLKHVNLVIPQETSLEFTIVHKVDGTGEIIDHSESVLNMAFQYKDKKTKEKVTIDLDYCCVASAEDILVTIPPQVTAGLPITDMKDVNWDLIVTTVLGEQIRLCYGTVTIVDTYALDEE